MRSLQRIAGGVRASAAASSAVSLRSGGMALAAAQRTTALLCSAPVRHNSTLPIVQEYVRRTYPFPTILESNIPPDYSNWLYYHQQHPHDLPSYKSKLIVDVRDLGLDATSRMALRAIVGNRFDPVSHRVSFVSKNLPTAQANENRVFQMLDAVLLEARRIGKEMNEAGFHAKPNGAKHNRLIAPRPPKLTKKHLRAQKAKDAAAAAPAEGAAAAPAAPASKRRGRFTEKQLSMRALGMTSSSTTKDLTPPPIVVSEKIRAKSEAINQARIRRQQDAPKAETTEKQ